MTGADDGRPGRKPAAVRPALPDEAIDRLHALSDRISFSTWEAAEEVAAMSAEYGNRFSRRQAADALRCLPSTVGDMIRTVERAAWLRKERVAEDVTYSDALYIARHPEPKRFFQQLLESMDDWGGRFPPVRVIRQQLAQAHGKERNRKPQSFTATVDEIFVRPSDPGKRIIVLLADADTPELMIQSEVIIRIVGPSRGDGD